jgi:hypothetical protein
MPCFAPIDAWSKHGGGVTFKLREAFGTERYFQLSLPCGRCIGCRVMKARTWAMRCVHEAKCHESNAFITLTYAPENCPPELRKRDLQLFLKRLRKLSARSFRYFAVGEYGSKYSRPHYHAILFGFDFQDRQLHGGSPEHPIYRSALLEKAWPHGFSTVGSVTPASAQYVAQYTVKKLNGDAAARYNGRQPEFALMSLKPGIGALWIDRYHSSIFPRDFVVVEGGRRASVPQYYLKRQPEAMQEFVKRARKRIAMKTRDDPEKGIDRRTTQLESLELRTQQTHDRRSYENDSPRIQRPR